jgi:twitching motility protein PilT
MDLYEVIREVGLTGASDIHIKVGNFPIIRKDGQLVFCKGLNETAREDVLALLTKILSPEKIQLFEKSKELDFGADIRGAGRIRINLYQEKGEPALAIRFVPETIRSIEELNLPPILNEWALTPRGLVICTGTVGSGKSTAMAAMLDYVNKNVSKNILTIEDPIEFLFKDNKSIISQREVGIDTHTFGNALRHVFREDPDIIYVGEIRDAETMEVCIKIADTGHLVFSTLHTMDATEAINRAISFFPPHQHQHIRALLASTLVGVASLRLLPKKDGKGRVPACEILVVTQTVKDYIMDPDKTKLIPSAIEEGQRYYNMQSFDNAVFDLYQKGLIAYEVAKCAVTSVDEFERRVKGIDGKSYSTQGSNPKS